MLEEAMLMMLAFLVDQAQQLACRLFQAVWEKLGHPLPVIAEINLNKDLDYELVETL